MKNKKSARINLGDVFEIPLPDGRFAYGRVYDDAGVGIYREISNKPKSPPVGSREFMFNVGIYEDVLKSGEWKVIGSDPFDENESRFPPPEYIKDVISGEYSIYHQGEMRSATESECQGLEECAVWDSHHIVERIMDTIRGHEIPSRLKG